MIETNETKEVAARTVTQSQIAKNKASADMYLPTTKSEAYKIAESFSQSQFCPKQYQGKPADVYLAMAYGAQIGLNPLLAVQNIAVVNGRPAVFGDALTAIAQGHAETEQYEDGYLEDGTAYCIIVRNGRKIYRTFSVEQAKRAGLWGTGTWTKYPERMLLWRARGWAIRDAFADVLMGLWSYEEAVDSTPIERNVTPEHEAKAGSAVDSLKAELKKSKKAKEDMTGKVAPIEAEESQEVKHASENSEDYGPEFFSNDPF